MKRIIITFFIVLCAASAKAQWSVTPEVGITAVNKVYLKDWQSNYKVGAAVEYEFNNLFAIKSGIHYTNRAFSYNSFSYWSGYWGENNLVMMNVRQSYGFLQLPVMAKFGWTVGDDVRFNIAAGPYLAYCIRTSGEMMISGRDDYGYGYGYGYGSGSGYYHSGYSYGFESRRFDWGGSISAGMEVKNWVMNLGYDISMGKEGSWDTVSANYHTISLTVGYKFRF